MKDFLQAVIKHSSDSHTDESKRRAKICENCNDKSKAVYGQFVNSQIKEINGYVCKRCKCPIATKIFAAEPKNICVKWKL